MIDLQRTVPHALVVLFICLLMMETVSHAQPELTPEQKARQEALISPEAQAALRPAMQADFNLAYQKLNQIKDETIRGYVAPMVKQYQDLYLKSYLQQKAYDNALLVVVTYPDATERAAAMVSLCVDAVENKNKLGADMYQQALGSVVNLEEEEDAFTRDSLLLDLAMLFVKSDFLEDTTLQLGAQEPEYVQAINAQIQQLPVKQDQARRMLTAYRVYSPLFKTTHMRLQMIDQMAAHLGCLRVTEITRENHTANFQQAIDIFSLLTRDAVALEKDAGLRVKGRLYMAPRIIHHNVYEMFHSPEIPEGVQAVAIRPNAWYSRYFKEQMSDIESMVDAELAMGFAIRTLSWYFLGASPDELNAFIDRMAAKQKPGPVWEQYKGALAVALLDHNHEMAIKYAVLMQELPIREGVMYEMVNRLLRGNDIERAMDVLEKMELDDFKNTLGRMIQKRIDDSRKFHEENPGDSKMHNVYPGKHELDPLEARLRKILAPVENTEEPVEDDITLQ